MHRKIVTSVILLAEAITALSQQWVDKKYAYDSLPDVQYGTAVNFAGGTDTLYMDIFLPQCDDINHVSTRPLLMWVHGGAFLAGNKNDTSIQDLCRQFAKRGYVTASIDYRLGYVSDDVYWQCNYPNYSCVFAADSAEWARAYFRAVQDGKGALRYLINRNQQFRIDTSNVFVAGESAGAFVALGISLLDTLPEKPPQAYAMADAALPHPGNLNCTYNAGKTFNASSISRPDLGDIDGTIEPSTIHFTIKGVGNMYGAMLSDLLKHHQTNKPKPSIFSFHQPCDIVVPIDSATVYWGITWCLTNGYNCYGITNNNIKLFGSRAFSNWNTTHNYGYAIHDEFTGTNFPYNFLFGPGSCADQINNPCHAYDNKTLRENNLASYFANLITTDPICDTTLFPTGISQEQKEKMKAYPNPTHDFVTIDTKDAKEQVTSVIIFDLLRNICFRNDPATVHPIRIDAREWANGFYLIELNLNNGQKEYLKILKQ